MMKNTLTKRKITMLTLTKESQRDFHFVDSCLPCTTGKYRNIHVKYNSSKNNKLKLSIQCTILRGTRNLSFLIIRLWVGTP